MGRLDDRVALVTGAARGTGEAIARLFAREGARVILCDVNEELGAKVAAELGDAAAFRRLDVGVESEWESAVADALSRFGQLDALVNNAALLHLSALEETDVADFERLVRVNQIGPFLGMKAVTATMREAGRGSIVNIASVDGLQGKNGAAVYASTKWALRGLTKVAALELGRYGIRVNAVCPEAGSAEMIAPYVPAGVDMEKVFAMYQTRLATQKGRTVAERLEDVARMVCFLASDESASCTGADFVVDSGNTAGTIVKGAPGT